MQGCHLVYISHEYTLISAILYCMAIIVPPFVSSIRYMRFFGVAVAASLAVSLYAYYQAAVSVWCFFAALISLLVVALV
jgi:hypothetical protein